MLFLWCYQCDKTPHLSSSLIRNYYIWRTKLSKLRKVTDDYSCKWTWKYLKKSSFLLESDSTIGNVYLSVNANTILKLLVAILIKVRKRNLVVTANNVEAQNFWVNWVFTNSLACKERLWCLNIKLFLSEPFHFLNKPSQGESHESIFQQ